MVTGPSNVNGTINVDLAAKQRFGQTNPVDVYVVWSMHVWKKAVNTTANCVRT